MKAIVGLVNYGASGNLESIRKAFEHAGVKVLILSGNRDFKKVDKIVLPGVGSFKDAMEKIGGMGMRDILIQQMREKTTLGICLGMQIMATLGFEFGETNGLGIIQGEVKKMEIKCKVPHMGWGRLEVMGSNNPLFKNITADDAFYFMHSYEVLNFTDVAALTTYCSHKFVSAVRKGNIFGVQFHPEKSRESGFKIIKNFLKL